MKAQYFFKTLCISCITMLSLFFLDGLGMAQIEYKPNGNVGIGTTEPGYKLDVNGTIRSTSNLYVMGGSLDTAIGSPQFYRPAADTLGIATNGAERLRIDNSGNVGIGTTVPGTTLDVDGRGRFYSVGDNPTSGSGVEILYVTDIGQIISYDRAGSVYESLRIEGNPLTLNFASGANVGIGPDATPDYLLDVQGTLHADGTTTIDGNVGIGTTEPGTPLHVYAGAANGNIKLTRAGTAEWVHLRKGGIHAASLKVGTEQEKYLIKFSSF